MKTSSRALIVTSMLLCSFCAHAINKCVDDKGSVSFQDKPCKAEQSSEIVSITESRDSANTDNLTPVYVQIPGVGDGVMFSYKWWDTTVIQPNPDMPPTVKMTAKAGEEPISFSLTFIPNKLGKAISLEESADTVYTIGSRYAASSVEQEVQLETLDTTIGTAVYASFNEARYQKVEVPAGEYSSITVGQAAHSKIVVGFTILTNGSDSKALTEALNIIGSFQIVASAN